MQHLFTLAVAPALSLAWYSAHSYSWARHHHAQGSVTCYLTTAGWHSTWGAPRGPELLLVNKSTQHLCCCSLLCVGIGAQQANARVSSFRNNEITSQPSRKAQISQTYLPWSTAYSSSGRDELWQLVRKRANLSFNWGHKPCNSSNSHLH